MPDSPPPDASDPPGSSHDSLYDLTMTGIDGNPVALAEFRGQVLVIANVASQCGLTPHYEGLQALHAQYADQGVSVLGFPCNQFAGQEPGSDADVCAFAQGNYGVTFPLFSKIDVNGPTEAPLYALLKAAQPGDGESSDIAWNFEKFLVGREGQVLARFAPPTPPADLAPAIEAAL
ncbi:MAG TPA: glutathione peroxidase [Ilumatobacter sp.]|nr:glutathione peroxidase [Ilumatobacter sp.]